MNEPLSDRLLREGFAVVKSVLPDDHPEFSHLIGSARLQDLIHRLGHANSCWLSGYLISKPPNSPALFWHQDWWGWDHPLSYTNRLPGLGIMIYLSDTSMQNGCLRVIPGSHRCRHRLHDLPVAHEEALSSIADPDNIAYQSDDHETAVEVDAGDVVLLDPRLLHSAYANQTTGERSLITLWYLPDFNELPASIRARYPVCGAHIDPQPWNRAPQQRRMFTSIDNLHREADRLCD